MSNKTTRKLEHLKPCVEITYPQKPISRSKL